MEQPSFIRRLFGWNTTETLGAAVDPSFFGDIYGPQYEPEEVTILTAENNPTVSRAINLVANDIARLPVVVCDYDNDGDLKEDPEHAVSYLLEKPSELETGFDFFRKHARYLMLYGNSFALVSRRGTGEIVQLISCNPIDITQIDGGDGTFVYRHTYYGEVDPKDMLHFRLKGARPFWGDSPITRAHKALELAMVQEEAGAQLYRTPGLGKVALEIPETVGPDKVKAGQEAFKRVHGGKDGHLAPVIVQNGTAVKQIGTSLKDSDWVTARRFSITQVGQMFSIPPSFLFNLEDATLENSTMAMKSYVSTCLEHWLSYFRSEFKLKLDVNIKFDTSSLIVGSFKEEVESLRMAIDCGLITANEGREKLGFEAHPDGDTLMISKNYTDAGDNEGVNGTDTQSNKDSNNKEESDD